MFERENNIHTNQFFRIAQTEQPLILEERPHPLVVSANVTNTGPDLVLLVSMNISSKSLSLSRVNMMGLSCFHRFSNSKLL